MITRNGKPFAILVQTEPAEVEDTLRAIRAERFATTVRKIRRHAAEAGLDRMTMEEIDAEIVAVRSRGFQRSAREVSR